MGLRAVSLCSGIEGLGLGVELALDALGLGPLEPVLHVEREAYPAAVLATRMEDKAIPQTPIWSDLGTVTGAECGAYLRAVSPIDLVFGGIPCQPWSVAGKQAGKDDDRDLWPLVEDLLGFLDCPEWFFLENVSGFAVWDGLGRVAGGLRGMGYRVAAVLLGAGDVGATHRRKRLFVLAHRQDANRRNDQPERVSMRRERLAGSGGELADASCERRQQNLRGASVKKAGENSCHEPQYHCKGMADAANLRRSGSPERERGGTQIEGRLQESESGNARMGFPLFPPGPADFGAWARVLEIDPGLAPATEPGVRGMADEFAPRLERLRALGNGVVPLSAAYAFCTLYAALTEAP